MPQKALSATSQNSMKLTEQRKEVIKYMHNGNRIHYGEVVLIFNLSLAPPFWLLRCMLCILIENGFT